MRGPDQTTYTILVQSNQPLLTSLSQCKNQIMPWARHVRLRTTHTATKASSKLQTHFPSLLTCTLEPVQSRKKKKKRKAEFKNSRVSSERKGKAARGTPYVLKRNIYLPVARTKQHEKEEDTGIRPVWRELRERAKRKEKERKRKGEREKQISNVYTGYSRAQL